MAFNRLADSQSKQLAALSVEHGGDTALTVNIGVSDGGRAGESLGLQGAQSQTVPEGWGLPGGTAPCWHFPPTAAPTLSSPLCTLPPSPPCLMPMMSSTAAGPFLLSSLSPCALICPQTDPSPQ